MGLVWAHPCAAWGRRSYTHFLVAVQSPDLYTLNLGVGPTDIRPARLGTAVPAQAAAAIALTILVAIVFFTFQRYFVRGASEGAVEG